MVLHGAVRVAGRSALRLLSDREYRRVTAWSLRRFWQPRHKPGRVVINGHETRFPDWASFLSAYEEIFAAKIYAFRSQRPDPRIFDLGANVGLSVIFFKQQYPDAKIVALEPDPAIYRYLDENVRSHGLTNVELRNQAVWTERTQLQFAADGADGGRLSQSGGISVEAVPVGELLGSEPIDFLKMDIEGAENEVLPACADQLKKVEHVFVEYHSDAREKQKLARIIETLDKAGFRISLDTIYSPDSPLLGKPEEKPFDLQVNIFGRR